ncbi:Ig-like domain-containing protein [Melittangium boletus]|uniref:Ig-like domain-containing protein n=1 Tax=Melittangium boletus TaxID=83453 RepID=UPI003DA51B61
MRSTPTTWLLLLSFLFLGLGCPTAKPGTGLSDAGTDPQVDPDADHPLAARFLPAKLPWKASRHALADDAYPVQLNSIPPQQLSWREPRWRPVILDRDTVAVVFPPEDRSGFDIAWGGYEKPWRREPLLDLRPELVGALDVVADASGTVWVAFRPRERHKPLKLVRWRPGEAAQVEDVPLPLGMDTRPLKYLEACPDLTLGSAPDGALDLIMRGDPSVWKPLLFHGKRVSGSKAFAWNLVADSSKGEGSPPGLEQIWDMGCRNALAYDEQGHRVLLSMIRPITTSYASPLKHFVEAFREGRDGRFWRVGNPVLSLPSDRESGQRGVFDLHDHPSGFLFAGPSREIQRNGNEPRGELPWVYMRALSDVRDPLAFNARERYPDEYRFRAKASHIQTTVDPGAGGKLLADGCGNFRLAAVHFWALEAGWTEMPLGEVYPLCAQDPAPAPVFRGREGGSTQYPSFAHGRNLPFELGVCLGSDNGLEVCHGGHAAAAGEVAWEPLDPASGGGLARVVATRPGPGEKNVDLATEVTVTFDRPVDRPEVSDVSLWNLSRAERVNGRWEPVEGQPATLRLRPSRPLAAAHRYRLVVSPRLVSAPGELPTWKLPEGRKEVIDFETAGDADLQPDPRVAPYQLECEGTRDDSGCTLTVDDGQFILLSNNEPLRLRTTGKVLHDYGRSNVLTGRVEELDGGVRPDSGVRVALNESYLDVFPGLPLQEEHELRVVIPPVHDRFGREFEDTRVRLRLAHGPIRVVEFQPAAGAEQVPVTTSIAVRVNRPQSPPQWNATYFQLITYDAKGGSVLDYPPMDLTLEPPSTYRLIPRQPLRPGAYHELHVASTPKVLSGFWTAP